MPKWIASHSIYRTSVSIICFQILFRIRHRALVNCTIFSCSEVVHIWFVILREVDWETTSINECHATTFFFSFSTSINIFLVWICFSFYTIIYFFFGGGGNFLKNWLFSAPKSSKWVTLLFSTLIINSCSELILSYF